MTHESLVAVCRGDEQGKRKTNLGSSFEVDTCAVSQVI